LKKNGFEIGDSRTTVDSMIKKMKKREFITKREFSLRKYVDFKIKFFSVRLQTNLNFQTDTKRLKESYDQRWNN